MADNVAKRVLGTQRHGIPQFREGLHITTTSVVSDVNGALWQIDPENATIRELTRFFRKWGDEPQVIKVHGSDFTEMRAEATEGGA
jgi:hypothetical protein